MIGIQDSKDLLIFLSRTVNAIDKTLTDGKVTITDAVYIFSPLTTVQDAISGIDNVDNELLDLTQEEVNELMDVVARELDLTNDAVETLTEEALALALTLVQFVAKVKNLRASN